MDKTRIALVYILIACLSLILSSLPDSPRYINDGFDMGVYQTVGTWFTEGKQPYKDVFSPYPQLATYMFALPYAVTGYAEDPGIYRYIFSLLMDLCLATMIILIYQYRPVTKNLAFLLLLPASLYFTHNRFDIVPSLFVLISLLMLFNRNFYSAFIFLSISVLFKWYALVLLPVYVSYLLALKKKNMWQLLAAFFIPVLLVVLHSISTIGWDNFIIPYKFHLGMGTRQESLLYLLTAIINPVLNTGMVTPVLKPLFLALQFLVSFMVIFARPDTETKVIYWSIASIACFMLFAKYYSPQWILWVFPLLLLIARDKFFILMIILFDIFTYIYFPVVFGFRKSEHLALLLIFHLLIVIKTGFLIYFLCHAISGIQNDIKLPSFRNKLTRSA